MAASFGAFSRVFSQKCRIWSISVTRSGLLGSSQQTLPWIHETRDFSQSQDIPAKPKRPLTSFFQFALEQRPKIVAMEPSMSVTEVTKRIAAMWKDMSEHQKEVYRSDFETRREKYMEEMEQYRSRLTDEQLDTLMEQDRDKRQKRAKRRQKAELKKLNKPKRPPTGYSLFIKAHFNQRATGGKTREEVRVIFKEAASIWHSLPEYERQQYNEEASLLSETYREEMEEWKRKMEEEGIET
uniref:Mitochondrial transcription factor A n=1 Tax=Paracentrotus lividus TaxID=7656 RepID=U3KUX6_PARLI|nr:mitochondrial transcription factor A [Paracentrotus lividus]